MKRVVYLVTVEPETPQSKPEQFVYLDPDSLSDYLAMTSGLRLFVQTIEVREPENSRNDE